MDLLLTSHSREQELWKVWRNNLKTLFLSKNQEMHKCIRRVSPYQQFPFIQYFNSQNYHSELKLSQYAPKGGTSSLHSNHQPHQIQSQPSANQSGQTINHAPPSDSNIGLNNGQNQTNAIPKEEPNQMGVTLQIVRTIELSEHKLLEQSRNGAIKKNQKQTQPNKKHITPISTSLFLRYNKIKNLSGFQPIVAQIYPQWDRLQWIDLSHNRLTSLTDDFPRFPALKNLYLHVNFISSFKEFERLKPITNLRTLTLHANPLEKFGEWRVLTAHMLPQVLKIDSNLLTKRQRDRGAAVAAGMKKLPVITNPEQPPEDSQNEDD